MIKVALIEDDEKYRELLCHYLSGIPGLHLVSAYATAEEAVRRFPREKPDVAIVRIKLPGMDGIECIRCLRQLVPALSTEFIILTGREDSRLIFESLRAGAHGYLLKHKTNRQRLLAAIKEVAAGGSPMTPSVARQVVTHFENKENGQIRLTGKEWAVLRDLMQGLQYKEIADKHSISLNTVRKHIRAIYDKLHVHSRKEAARRFQNRPSPPADSRKMYHPRL